MMEGRGGGGWVKGSEWGGGKNENAKENDKNTAEVYHT